jgi:hypothetical protein
MPIFMISLVSEKCAEVPVECLSAQEIYTVYVGLYRIEGYVHPDIYIMQDARQILILNARCGFMKRFYISSLFINLSPVLN